MSRMPYHKRYHSDALSGFMSLTLEERGAYQTILDLIYDHGGAIADNERLLAGYMNCSVRKWKSLRQTLLEKGKIEVTTEGRISNSRAEKEIENSSKTSRKRAESGLSGGRKKAENRKNDNENNDGDEILPEQKSSHTRALPETRYTVTNVTDVDDEKSTGPKPDRRTEIWNDAKAYLGAKRASLVGKWVNDYGLETFASALASAKAASNGDGAFEPVPYIAKILQGGMAPAGGSFLDFLSQQDSQRKQWAAGDAP